jgi:uncharacterized protein (DUF2062 family)
MHLSNYKIIPVEQSLLLKYIHIFNLKSKRKSSSNFMGIKKRTKFIEKITSLKGDPHLVAMGMAVGIFVAIIPAIPFHTIIALTLAYILKASRPAAILGTLTCNPFTVVFTYYACYKTGNLLFGGTLAAEESVLALIDIIKQDTGFYDKIFFFADFARTQLKVFAAMIVGGVTIGVPSGIVSYFITKQLVIGVRAASK